MKIVSLRCSLHPKSRSRVLARAAEEELARDGVEVDVVDLAEVELPLCDGAQAYGHAAVAPLRERLTAADAVVVSVPVYNYDVNAAAKNVVELTGLEAWSGKVVGFLCAAGGEGSYMSVMPFANSLMLDFRTLVVPRFVYATGGAFDAERSTITDPEVRRRVSELAAETVRLTRALQTAG